MTIDTKDMINSILESISRIDHVKPEDIPNIDLYMDQVTTFMDAQLASSKRYPQDKILTKTMINNYAKNHLLPSPNKKKYSREHLLMLVFIYYFKNILSISDIEALMKPLTEKYFQKEDSMNLESVYREVFSMEKEQVEAMKEDLFSKYQTSQSTFTDASEEEQEFLRLFSFISLLSFDVYVKKQLIEKIIDSFSDD
ncbi:MAG: DUF1836 domain-containing protein [Eubacteriales bacterium]|nr:DUF1836 domain-containing protein [Eubacteriales bacterium]